MQHRVLQWLACPACGNEELVLETSKTEVLPVFGGVNEGETEVTDVIEGALHCGRCAAIYPIRDGVPRMVPRGAQEGPASGHRWTTFDETVPEFEANFLDMTEPLKPKDFLGRLVLDAGAGFGRHAFYAARYGAEVVALDSAADAVASARANCRRLPRVHVVQGDLLHPPLRPEVFDLVYCFGVLHHLPNAQEGFRSLGRMVKPGGHLQVWVYGPRAGTAAMASGALHGAATRMSDEQLHEFSRKIALGLRLFSHTPYRFMRGVPVVGGVLSHLPAHDHHQWPFEVVVADIFDRLRIPVHTWLRGEELERWFAEEGYADIRVSRRVRNAESFRGIGTRR